MHIIDKKVKAKIEAYPINNQKFVGNYNYSMLFRGEFPERCDKLEQKIKAQEIR